MLYEAKLSPNLFDRYLLNIRLYKINSCEGEALFMPIIDDLELKK